MSNLVEKILGLAAGLSFAAAMVLWPLWRLARKDVAAARVELAAARDNLGRTSAELEADRTARAKEQASCAAVLDLRTADLKVRNDTLRDWAPYLPPGATHCFDRLFKVPGSTLSDLGDDLLSPTCTPGRKPRRHDRGLARERACRARRRQVVRRRQLHLPRSQPRHPAIVGAGLPEALPEAVA